MLPPEAPPILQTALEDASRSIVPTVASDLRLTDDHAPVEMLVDAMVIEFLLSGGVSDLQ